MDDFFDLTPRQSSPKKVGASSLHERNEVYLQDEDEIKIDCQDTQNLQNADSKRSETTNPSPDEDFHEQIDVISESVEEESAGFSHSVLNKDEKIEIEKETFQNNSSSNSSCLRSDISLPGVEEGDVNKGNDDANKRKGEDTEIIECKLIEGNMEENNSKSNNELDKNKDINKKILTNDEMNKGNENYQDNDRLKEDEENTAYEKWFLEKYKKEMIKRKTMARSASLQYLNEVKQNKQKMKEREKNMTKVKEWLKEKKSQERKNKKREEERKSKEYEIRVQKKKMNDTAFEEWLQKHPTNRSSKSIGVMPRLNFAYSGFRKVYYKDTSAPLVPSIVNHKPWLGATIPKSYSYQE